MPTATFPKILWAFVPMVPSEGALVSFYRPSMVTLPPSLRVSDISPLGFCSPYHFFTLFPIPLLVFPKFPHVLLGVGGSPFGYKERRLIVRAISFRDFQPMWSQTTNVTDVRWTICDRKTAFCTKVHCAVKTIVCATDSTFWVGPTQRQI